MESDLSRILNAAAGGLVLGLLVGLLCAAVEGLRWLTSKLRLRRRDRHDSKPRLSAVVLVLYMMGGTLTSDALAQETQLDVGGTAVAFSPLPGWCVYPGALLSAALDQLSRTDRTNVAHVLFGDCREIEANAVMASRIRNFGILMTPKEFLNTNLGSRRAEFVATMTEALKTHDPHPAMLSARDRLNNAEFNIRVGETRSLGLIAQDRDAVYSGMVSKLRIGLEEFAQVVVYGMTVINGKIITCYIYSDHMDETTLKDALARVQLQIARLIDGNT